MQKIIIALALCGVSALAFSAPVTYKSVYNDPKKYQGSPHHHYHKYPNQHRSHYPSYPQHYPQHYPQQPHVSVRTPNVGIYVPLPQSEYHYQQTEEVYLPHGGTYRKTTDYIQQSPRYRPVQPHSGKILKQGHFYIEQDGE